MFVSTFNDFSSLAIKACANFSTALDSSCNNAYERLPEKQRVYLKCTTFAVGFFASMSIAPATTVVLVVIGYKVAERVMHNDSDGDPAWLSLLHQDICSPGKMLLITSLALAALACGWYFAPAPVSYLAPALVSAALGSCLPTLIEACQMLKYEPIENR